ncbi:hypothetical protein CSIM01_06409 [Colletotrichum simmondsii]|uniref:Uncharacterized protein n=1 Tax=Colletotrichum simmondsii TaxID=703756 RepID=A0A135SWE3_9PEZI|nr:hypothetical protein CSIM01_06409 [Colletotrichum simmondsii]
MTISERTLPTIRVPFPRERHPIPTQLIHYLPGLKTTLLEEPLRKILRPPFDMCDQPSVAFYCTRCGKPYASVFLPGKFERCQNPEPCKKIIELDGGSVARGVCEDCTRHLVVIRALALVESERLRNWRKLSSIVNGVPRLACAAHNTSIRSSSLWAAPLVSQSKVIINSGPNELPLSRRAEYWNTMLSSVS